MTHLLIAALAQGPADPVPFQKVAVRDRFWTPRMATNHAATVAHCFMELEENGYWDNFRLAAAHGRTGYKGPVYMDSDAYKVLEGAAMTLANHPDPALEKKIDGYIALIAAAQRPDGYVNTWYEVNAPDKVFNNLRDNHELYCAGHLIEAAVAHTRATGKKNLLNVATKFADLLDRTFGPGGREGYCGHPELELALVKLGDVTGEKRYHVLAEKMVETRGSHFFAREHNQPEKEYDGTYWIDDVPITEHREIKGHAVRAAYLMSGTTDVARLDGDPALTKMLDRVWRNVTTKRAYVTGGIGPSASNEGFTVDYDLPNATAYQESCASVAMAQWGWRMGLLHADARYFDAVETSLMNATLAGVNLKGDRFFYTNPLASRGDHHRSEWFGTACCPPNLLRTIASVGGYAYAARGRDLFVNLYLPGHADLGHAALDVRGDYPWDGRLAVAVAPEDKKPFALRLRIPGWARSYSARLNGKPLSAKTENGYLVVDRAWAKGDVVTLDLPMPVERIAAHPMVKDDQNRLAVRRGPLVYCLEGVDQTVPVGEIVLPASSVLKPTYRKEFLGGVVTLDGLGARAPEQEWDKTLYQPVKAPAPTPVCLIPYAFWDNRKPSPMELWLPSTPPPAPTGGVERKATVEMSHVSAWCQPEAIHDGVEPKSSGEQPAINTHFWPRKGGEEWVAYRWKKPVRTAGVKVYWFDDTGRGECKVPRSWRIEAWRNGAWRPIEAKTPVEIDRWTEVRFPAVETTGLRLVIQQQDGWATGIHEWKVIEEE